MMTRGLSIFKRKNKKVFGVPLEEAIEKSTINNGLPLILTRCVDYLERTAIKLEGIYRRSGNQKTVEDLIKLYDMGKDPDLEEYDPFVISGLLKRYFTLLPDPITSFDLYDKFIAAQMLQNKLLRPKQMKVLIDELPKANQYVLYFIIQHLVAVAKYETENKMGINNLAIVFGPTLLRSRDDSPVRLLSDVAFLRGCVETFIKDFDTVFASIIPANERVPVNEDGFVKNVEDDASSKRKGVSMNDTESLTQERNHLRFLLDKIAEDTKREESEMGRVNRRVKRDLESNIKRFELVDEQIKKIAEDVRKEEQQQQQQKTDRHESTSPSDMHKESEEEFVKSLEEVVVDLENPFEGISERIFRRMKRANLPIGKETTNMTLQELYDEKSILKRELRYFDDSYKKKHGEEPEKSKKEPLRQIYNRYKEVRSVIPQRERAAYRKAMTLSAVPSTTYQPPSPRLSDADAIGTNSPIFGLTEQGRPKTTELVKQSPRSLREINSDIPERVTSDTGSSTKETSERTLSILEQDPTYLELKKEKKSLQILLHKFQNDFVQTNGRKVSTKTDRLPLEKEYKRYKEVKNLINQMVADAETKNQQT